MEFVEISIWFFDGPYRFIDGLPGLPFFKMGGFSMASCEKSSEMFTPRDPRDCRLFSGWLRMGFRVHGLW